MKKLAVSMASILVLIVGCSATPNYNSPYSVEQRNRTVPLDKGHIIVARTCAGGVPLQIVSVDGSQAMMGCKTFRIFETESGSHQVVAQGRDSSDNLTVSVSPGERVYVELGWGNWQGNGGC